MSILEHEHKIDNNHFIIQYKNDSTHYLVRCIPFAVYYIDKEIAEDLINNVRDVETITNQEYEENIFTQPGIFYQPIIIMTNRCNLQCKYCYADSGSYGFGEFSDISNETIKKVVDFTCNNIMKYKEKIAGKDIELAFVAFGGESLINIDALRYLIFYAKQSCDKMSDELHGTVRPLIIINTNGLLINRQLLDELKPYKQFIEFVVSFDGIYHDENRLDYAGNGSKQRVISGINLLNEYGYPFYITCCLVPGKLYQTAENVKYIRSVIGPDKQINLSFIRGAVENVKNKVQYPGRLQQQYTEENVSTFITDVINLIENDDNIYFDKFLRKATAGGFANKCASCLFEFCVIGNGNVYPCHNFINDNYCIGNIVTDSDFTIASSKIYEKFLARTVNELDPCKDCFLKSVCISSFDCPSHSENDLGNFNVVDRLICKAGKEIQEAILYKILNKK